MGLVDFDAAALEAMSGGDPDQPVVMLNLLRYRDVAEPGHGVDGLSGREAFDVYGRRLMKLNARFGVEPIWIGQSHRTVIGDEEWSAVMLVRYPSRRHFVEMMKDPDYLAISPIRAAALADSRLVETTQLVPRP
ncbi:MAG: DUF1330 domain-containing protein [Minwuia sp.]|uniref:DUF1330 domain-containing protein n=1 Tax=Minwuia sp. TaxID=2493630 RepID=UPI003A849BEF